MVRPAGRGRGGNDTPSPEYTDKLILTHVEDSLFPSCSYVSQKSLKYYSIFRKSSATYCCGKSGVPALWLNQGLHKLVSEPTACR